MFALVPKVDKTDLYAAGFDGNAFDTEEEATSHIPALRAVGEAFDIDWCAVEIETPENLKRWIIWDPKDGLVRRDEQGDIISDGVLGRLGVGSVYLNAYAKYPNEMDGWPLRAHQKLDVGTSVWAEFSLSGERGTYEVIRVK